MGFRENLKSELVFQDIRIKELAHKSGINPRTIEQYLSAAAKMPSAENAVKIASALGVSVEYLVTGEEKGKEKLEEEQNQLRLYRKHSEIIKKCEEMSSEKEKLLVDFLDKFGKI